MSDYLKPCRGCNTFINHYSVCMTLTIRENRDSHLCPCGICIVKGMCGRKRECPQFDEFCKEDDNVV